MKRPLIVGASGQVGSQLLSVLGREGAVPTSRDAEASGWISFDLESIAGSPREAERRLVELNVDAIYCTGGMTDVERCESEPELANRINCDGPAALAAAAHRRGLPFVFFSSEYVFDGENGPYAEASQAAPINAYGHSKWLGELAVSEAHPEALILRTTNVYGPDPTSKNFLYSLARTLRSGQLARVAADQISTPTYNYDVAAGAVKLLNCGARGIFHLCGPELLSRAEFAIRAAKEMGLDSSRIVAVLTADLGQKARRPLNGGLVTEKVRRLYPDLHLRGFEESIRNWVGVGGFKSYEATGTQRPHHNRSSDAEPGRICHAGVA
jgi:dTDP-4-dehydrorhamnose reductase